MSRRDRNRTTALKAERKPEREKKPLAKRGESKARPETAKPRRPIRERPAVRVAPPPPKPAPAPIQKTTGIEMVTVPADADGMRVDRYLSAHFPTVSFTHLQRVIRKGELQDDGKRVDPKDRLAEGQTLRIPPMKLVAAPTKERSVARDAETLAFLASITLYEDDDVLVLNKPMGLAVQGGSGTSRHVDGMLAVMEGPNGQRPRLVHRIDKDTSGCLLIAKTRVAASALTKSFRTRSTRKVYWALVAGLPKMKQGRISTFLAKDEEAGEAGQAKMKVAEHGDDGASHALTYYAVVEHAGKIASWVSLKPVTGRTHQLRAHMASIDHPIIGDEKYFDQKALAQHDWEMPPGIPDKLHLVARRIAIPHPRSKGIIDVTAPLPPHMRESWELLGFDADRFDPIEDAPEE